MTRVLTALVAAIALASCAEPGDGQGKVALDVAEDSSGEGADDAVDLAEELADTGWETRSAEGTTFITYLDEGGIFRDLEDDEQVRSGRWHVDPEDRLCFRPEGATEETCWETGEIGADGVMEAVGEDGMAVRLHKVAHKEA